VVYLGKLKLKKFNGSLIDYFQKLICSLKPLVTKLKRLKKLRNALIVIVISGIVAFTGLFVLESNYNPTVIDPFGDIRFSIPIDVASSGYLSYNESISPGYFSSSANVYAFMYSPYADIFKFKLEVSYDNNTWIEVPFIKSNSKPEDFNQYANLGIFSIENPTTLKVYCHYVIPPQNISLPPNTTPYMILKSINGQILLKQETNAHDQMLEVLVFITLFSLSLSVVRLLRDEWTKEAKQRNS
jgi:hypothetical protein